MLWIELRFGVMLGSCGVCFISSFLCAITLILYDWLICGFWICLFGVLLLLALDGFVSVGFA